MCGKEYHARLRDRLAVGGIAGGLVAWCQAKGFMVVEGKLAPLGRGEMVMDPESLSFDNGRRIYRLHIPEVTYAFLNLRNHLVVSDGKLNLELKILSDSPVRLEDYLGAARKKPMQLWRPEENAKHSREDAALVTSS